MTPAAPGAGGGRAGDLLRRAGSDESAGSRWRGQSGALRRRHKLLKVTVSIGGQNANVAFAGLTPTLVGLYQVNVTMPAGVTPGNSVPVLLTVARARQARRRLSPTQ